MRNALRLVLFSLLAPTALVLAQQPPAAAVDHPLTASSKGMYEGIQKIFIRTVEMMPEEHYGFKPAETVRSFGQIVGHVTDAQYIFCSRVLGEKNPSPQVEKTKTAKPDLIAALKEAFVYCNRAYASVDDDSGTEMVKFMGGDSPKLGVLNTNQVHSIEHYGNLVTYMRIKGMVPPTSDPEFMKELMK